MGTQNRESLAGGIQKTDPNFTGNKNFSAGQYANTQQNDIREKDRKIDLNEESELDFGEGERLGESRGQDARRSLLDEDEHFKTNENQEGTGELTATEKCSLTSPEAKQVSGYGGSFSPKEMNR